MRIDVKDGGRRTIGRVEVDPARRPVRVPLEGTEREIFLEWDSALDDGGSLRRCLVCGCPELYHEKAYPAVTGFVVVLAFAGSVVGLLGFADRPDVLAALAVVLLADVALFSMTRRRLVCYRCHSAYRDLAIPSYVRAWDRARADRHAGPGEDAAPRLTPAPPAEPADGDEGAPAAEARGHPLVELVRRRRPRPAATRRAG